MHTTFVCGEFRVFRFKIYCQENISVIAVLSQDPLAQTTRVYSALIAVLFSLRVVSHVLVAHARSWRGTRLTHGQPSDQGVASTMANLETKTNNPSAWESLLDGLNGRCCKSRSCSLCTSVNGSFWSTVDRVESLPRNTSFPRFQELSFDHREYT